MTPDDYRAGLLARQQAQLAHAAVAQLADAAITLSAAPVPRRCGRATCPAKPLAPRPTGDFVFNAPSSMLFAPVVTVPLMSVGGLPVGVQLMGQQHEDARDDRAGALVRREPEAGRCAGLRPADATGGIGITFSPSLSVFTSSRSVIVQSSQLELAKTAQQCAGILGVWSRDEMVRVYLED